jgi:hypothetical protein
MAAFMPENTFPVDDQIGIKTAERKRKFAEALRQQATTPQGQMVGGIYVAPSITQYLASGLKQYQAGQLEREGSKQEEEIYRNRGETMRQAAQRYADALKPKIVQEGENTTKLPFEPAQMDRFGSPQAGQTQAVVTSPNMVTKQPTIEDMLMAQQQYAQDVNDPNALMSSANTNMNYQIGQQTRQDERAFRSQEAQLQREQRMQELQMRLQDSQLSREQNAALRREMAQLAASNKQQAQPYFQAVPTSQGYARFNARTGQMEPIDMGGGTVLPAAQDPNLQGQLAGAKEAGKVAGGARAESALQLPQVVAEAENTVKLVDDLLKSPGYKQAVGGSRMFGVQNIPGTSAKDFDIRLDQLKGKQFLQAFESLKGGGQITEVEGRKATEAISRMNASASEEEFEKAAREFQNIIRTGVQRAKAKAGQSAQPSGIPPGAVRRVN